MLAFEPNFQWNNYSFWKLQSAYHELFHPKPLYMKNLSSYYKSFSSLSQNFNRTTFTMFMFFSILLASLRRKSLSHSWSFILSHSPSYYLIVPSIHEEGKIIPVIISTWYINILLFYWIQQTVRWGALPFDDMANLYFSESAPYLPPLWGICYTPPHQKRRRLGIPIFRHFHPLLLSSFEFYDGDDFEWKEMLLQKTSLSFPSKQPP